jgi:hypothetical protein
LRAAAEVCSTIAACLVMLEIAALICATAVDWA